MSDPTLDQVDFTEAHYREYLQIAKRHWRLVPFGRASEAGRLCLWRHDVDYSPHRALRLAEIEAEEGVSATYFLLLTSEHYNALESGIIQRLSRLTELGHEIALHFDPNVHGRAITNGADLERAAAMERDILGHYYRTQVRSISFHNPTVGPVLVSEDAEIAGMTNAYGRELKKEFAYVSDSNGYWRFQRLRDVLESGHAERLQVLTHPEWWTPDVMPPRARISRCIDGRSLFQHQFYDDFLDANGRVNVR